MIQKFLIHLWLTYFDLRINFNKPDINLVLNKITIHFAVYHVPSHAFWHWELSRERPKILEIPGSVLRNLIISKWIYSLRSKLGFARIRFRAKRKGGGGVTYVHTYTHVRLPSYCWRILRRYVRPGLWSADSWHEVFEKFHVSPRRVLRERARVEDEGTPVWNVANKDGEIIRQWVCFDTLESHR